MSICGNRSNSIRRAWGLSVAAICILTLALGCSGRSADAPRELSQEVPKELPNEPPSEVVLRDMGRECGIRFRHYDGSSGQRYIVESVAAGLALFDYDGDGYVDIYFLNGAPLPGCKVDEVPKNSLYRNQGNFQFVDVTDHAGVGDTGYGLGVACADYDNDGDLDLYLNNFGPNVLYRNNGDGTFCDVTEIAGVDCGDLVGAGASFLDADADGDLELYAANYVDFTCQNHVPCSVDGLPAYAGPKDYAPLPDVLYGNAGDGTFTDISEESGVSAVAGSGMGMVCADYDNDGDTDVFVCNDLRRNFLFENDGTGTFAERALTAGTAYNYYGNENASMGADCGDYNNDGWLDFYMTNYQSELPVLYENADGGFFNDVTYRTQAGTGTLQHVTWGNGLVDFNNDGHRDLFIACGHIQDNVDLRDDTTSYLAKNVLLMNAGGVKFVDVSEHAGDGMQVKLSSRGVGFDDLDNDGAVDVVVLNSRREATILRNETQSHRNWIEIQLHGVHSNRDGVGARVMVAAGDLTQVAEVHSGRGYQSHFGSRLHFGLPDTERVDRIQVRWLGGDLQVLTDVPTNQVLHLVERR